MGQAQARLAQKTEVASIVVDMATVSACRRAFFDWVEVCRQNNLLPDDIAAICNIEHGLRAHLGERAEGRLERFG